MADAITPVATPSAAPIDTVNQSLDNAIRNLEFGAGLPDEALVETKPEVKAEAKPAATPEEKKEAAKQLRKLIVDKKEYQVDEENFTRLAQKGAAAEKRFSEASALQKSVEAKEQQINGQIAKLQQFIQAFDSDPMGFLSQRMGIDKARQMVEPFLAQQLRMETMDPKDREILTLKQQFEAKQAEDAESQRVAMEKQTAEQTEQLRLKYQQVIIDAMDKLGLPKNPTAIGQCAAYMKAFLSRQANVPEGQRRPLTMEVMQDIVTRVRGDISGNVKEILGGYLQAAKTAHEAKDSQKLLSIGKDIIDILGESTVNLIRRADLARLRGNQPQMPQQKVLETPRTTQQQQTTKRYMSEDEWRAEARKNAAQYDAEMKRAQ